MNWLVETYPDHQGATVWVQDNGETKVIDCPDVLTAADKEQPRHVFLHWPKTKVWKNLGWSWTIQPQFDEVTPFSKWGLARVRVGKAWGVINEAGTAIQSPAFDVIEPFAEQGSARVSHGGKWGLLDPVGKLLVKPEWEDVQHFINGFIPVKKDGKWGYLDASGKLLIPCEWEEAWRFSPEGFAVVVRNAKRGIIDRTGKVIVEPVWDGAFNFAKEGIGMVRRGKGWGLIDISGRLLGEANWNPQWTERRFDLGFVPIIDATKRLLLRVDGTPLTATVHDALFMSQTGALLVKKPLQRTIVGNLGEILFSLDGTVDHYDSEGMALVNSNGRAGFIDRDGEWVVPLRAGKMRQFRDGMAASEAGGKWGFADRSGNIVVKQEWDEVKDFSGGLAAVQRGGKWGFIDRSGKLLIKVGWNDAREFREGRAAVKLGDKWGFVNEAGGTVAEPEWLEVGNFSEGFAAVRMVDESVQPANTGKRPTKMVRPRGEAKWSFIDRKGNPAFESRVWSMGLIQDTDGRFTPSAKPEFREGRVRYIGVKNGRSTQLHFDTKGVETPMASRDHSFPPGFSIQRTFYPGHYHNRRGTADGSTLLVDSAGAVVMPEADSASDLMSDFIPYVPPPKYGLIDSTGKIVAEPAWDEARILSPDWVWIRVGTKCGLADSAGKIHVRPEWDELDVLPVDSGSLGEDRKSVLIGRKGTGFLSPWIRVKDGGKAKILRTNGQPAVPDSLGAEYVDFYGPAHVVIKQRDGQGNILWSVYEPATGDQVKFPTASTFRWNWNEAMAGVLWIKDKTTSEWRLMGKRGNDFGHSQPEKEDPAGWGFMQGRAFLHKADGWVFVDTGIKPISPDKWEEVRDFSEGRAAVRRDGKWGFIGRDGKLLTAPTWDGVQDFGRGLAAVQKGRRWGYVDLDGKPVIEAVWDAATSFKKWRGEQGDGPAGSEPFMDVAEVEVNSAAALIDRTGALIVDPSQRRITREVGAVVNGKDRLIVMKNGEAVTLVKRLWDNIAISYDEHGRGVSPTRAWARMAGAAGASESDWALVDESGKPLTKPEWGSPWYDGKADPLAEGLLTARTKEQKYGLLRRDGTVVLKPQYDRVAWIAPKVAAVWAGETGGLVNAAGEWLFQDNANVRIARFGLKDTRATEVQHQHGLALIEDVPKWGYARLNR
ncbi:MAG: WG repeat-containing protein [Chthoniobacteraceae bacterium]